jgi:DNA-binding LytR/AlgR family response regulator
MNIRCYVIDDETDAIMLLKKYIGRTPGLELAGYSKDPLVALDDLTNNSAPELTFIDIDMRQLSGIQLAEMVNPYTSVIFTTAHPQYAIQAFLKEAWDYLLKPIEYDQFLWSIQRARKRLAKQALYLLPDENFFNIRSEIKGRMIKINTEEVMFIESAQNYIHVHTIAGKHMTYSTMTDVEEYLPAQICMRIHRSFIVNINFVKIIERNRIKLLNDTELVLGDHYKQQFLQMMDDRLLNPGKAS